jgi:Phage tail fibre repeat
MPFDQNNLPEWNAPGVEPPQSKKDSGWGVIEKPPADWFNWFFNKTYNALKSLFQNAQHKEEKGQPNGYASLDGSGKVPATQLPTATPTTQGAMSAADKAKLDGIAPGAEVNQNAFSNIKVGATTISADNKTDTLELVAGTNVVLTPDATNDKVTIALSSNVETVSGAQAKADAARDAAIAASAPINHVGAAGSSAHPDATPTTSGFMSAADKAKLDTIATGAEVNQNAFSNVKVGGTTIAADSKTDTLEFVAGSNITLTPDATNDKITIAATVPVTSVNGKTGAVSLTASDVGAETPAGAQAKANQAETNAKSYADSTAATAEANAKTYADQVAATAEANAKAASAPISHVGSGGAAHATATPTTAGFMSAADKAKLDGIQAGAEVNQNAFANVKVGATTIAADAEQDTLELAAGTAITLTADSTNDKVTIAVQLNDTVNSTSTTQAATANAVKQAYDRAVSAENNAKSYADTVAAQAQNNAIMASAPASHVGSGGSAHAVATPTTAGFMSAADKAKLDGIQSGAEVNQNAFSNIKVGATTIAADSETDTLELVAGTGITLTPDATNDKVTLAVSFGGSGSATTAARSDHTHGTATTSADGFMSAADKAKLDGIAAGAEVNQNAFTNIKVGATTISADSKTDTLELVAGNAISLTPDAINDKVTISVPTATPSADGAMSAADKAKLDGIAAGAEVNQNAFSTVKVGATTIAADSKTDTLELVSGTGIALTPDATNDKVTIAVSFGGNGSATTAARSDHNHDGTYAKLSGDTFTGPVKVASLQGTTNADVIPIGTGTSVIDTSGGGVRLKFDADNYLFINGSQVRFYFGGSVKHAFNSDGTKTGGSIEIDGKNYGMSPIDSPQVLLEYIEFDIPLTPEGTKVFLNNLFAKTIANFAVFPNNGKIIEKGPDYFVIAGEGTADCRIVGERIGYEGVFYDDLDTEGEA